jgi:hypothetical protein
MKRPPDHSFTAGPALSMHVRGRAQSLNRTRAGHVGIGRTCTEVHSFTGRLHDRDPAELLDR